jgi:hypothetical protein
MPHLDAEAKGLIEQVKQLGTRTFRNSSLCEPDRLSTYADRELRNWTRLCNNCCSRARLHYRKVFGVRRELEISGTWWIPMLLVLEVWQHLIRRFPLRYDPLYWGAVFPLGIYGGNEADGSDARTSVPRPLPTAFFCGSAGAWTLVFIGPAWEMMRKPRPSVWLMHLRNATDVRRGSVGALKDEKLKGWHET